MKQKIIVLLTIAFLLCLSFSAIPLSFAAADQIEDSYSYASATGVVGPLADIYPSATLYSSMGQSFNATKGGYISGFKVNIHKDGTPSGNLQAFIMGCGGDIAAAANATVYASSATVDVGTLSDGDNNVTFVFSEDYELVLNEPYWAMIEVMSGSWSEAANHVHISHDNTSPTHAGRIGFWWGAEWSVGNTDLVFEVSSSSYAIPDDPDDFPDLDWDSSSGIISAFTSFVIPLVILLLPVLLLITITRSTDKWIILIGLTIGAGLGYYFGMVPLWLVFLVVIGLIGMAYQSVRGGG